MGTGKIESFIEKHLGWIASVVIALGFYIAIIQGQSIAIDALKIDVEKQHHQLDQLERCVIKLEAIEKSMAELKGDVKEIKSILYKPIVGKEVAYVYTNEIAVRSSN